MGDGLNIVLVAVFAVHLVAFSVLLLRRRQAYYVALVLTFSLLTAAFSLRLLGWSPEWGGMGLDQVLRYAAWASAAVSLSWTGARIVRRIQAGRQNCS
jgi:NADH:ubiquinone oxidoreductase subunit 6 (subunit J)